MNAFYWSVGDAISLITENGLLSFTLQLSPLSLFLSPESNLHKSYEPNYFIILPG